MPPSQIDQDGVESDKKPPIVPVFASFVSSLTLAASTRGSDVAGTNMD